MSENAHDYQTTSSNEVPQESVDHLNVANAIDEKLMEQSQTLTSNDVEREQAATEENNENSESKDEFSSKFAALSRKEKDIRERVGADGM